MNASRRVWRTVAIVLMVPALCVLLLYFLASESITSAHAGIRGRGKYCGVVIFDRWDTCFLLSGPFITYVSESVKSKLRPYSGRAMQVDASDVFQPTNPGDALIRKYEIVGPAPAPDEWSMVDGLELVARSDFGQGGAPVFWIEIRNTSTSPISVDLSAVGPTLLASTRDAAHFGSDGRSAAVITRVSLFSAVAGEIMRDGVRYSWSSAIPSLSYRPDRFLLEPGQTMKARITFSAPAGEYQFICGYGGGVHEKKSIASNAISFDVDARGIATLVR